LTSTVRLSGELAHCGEVGLDGAVGRVLGPQVALEGAGRSTLQADIATEAGRVISAVGALCWRRGAARKEGSRRSEPRIRRAVAQVVEHLLSNIQG
jgi:hypothetical protein